MNLTIMHADESQSVPELAFPFLVTGAGDYHDLDDYRQMLDLLLGGVRMKEIDYGHGSDGYVGLFYRGELTDPANAAFLADVSPQ